MIQLLGICSPVAEATGDQWMAASVIVSPQAQHRNTAVAAIRQRINSSRGTAQASPQLMTNESNSTQGKRSSPTNKQQPEPRKLDQMAKPSVLKDEAAASVLDIDQMSIDRLKNIQAAQQRYLASSIQLKPDNLVAAENQSEFLDSKQKSPEVADSER